MKFGGGDRFLAELRRRVDAYFAKTGRCPRDCPAMYFKTAVVLGTCAGAYGLLVFVVSAWWLAVPLAVLLGLAMAAVGLNIQHDAGHRAYSRHGWVNRMMARTLDLVGGSSYIWDWKHNSMHHTYTNIAGHDDDIDVGFLGRLSPQQRRLWFHRLQHIYLWFLYGFLTIKWQLFDDFYNVAVGRIGQKRIPRPRGTELAVFITGKVLFFSLALVIPSLLHPFWAVASMYVLASFVCGVTLGVVFQLAHCVEAAQFPQPDDTGRMESNWAVHQLRTTADFGRSNPVLSWLIGGLNFQVEHHLLSGICHVHYRALSPLVEEACDGFGLPYNAHRGFLSALASHFRWLRRMGMADDSAQSGRALPTPG